MKKKRVLLGMSGGVDSSASAVLLLEQGYEVVGCTFVLWNSVEESNNAVIDAKGVCDKLNIEHHVLDFQETFKDKVINNFICEYQNARTPNPCVECNKHIKFGLLCKKAEELNCEYIATGHYAKIGYSEKYNQKVLKKANEIKKDQTYFLYTIQKNQIDKLIFPLQNYSEKEEIRKIAELSGLNVARKKDSQEICFIKDNDYQKFVRENSNFRPKKGNIVHKNGEILGKHEGLINYTIGQRKGIGIAYKTPLYVLELDKEKNEVLVGDESDLYKKELIAIKPSWNVEKLAKNNLECYAKIRYRSKEAKVKIYQEQEDKIKVVFEEPQRAITSGQSVVFYDEENILLGGAIIEKII